MGDARASDSWREDFTVYFLNTNNERRQRRSIFSACGRPVENATRADPGLSAPLRPLLGAPLHLLPRLLLLAPLRCSRSASGACAPRASAFSARRCASRCSRVSAAAAAAAFALSFARLSFNRSFSFGASRSFPMRSTSEKAARPTGSRSVRIRSFPAGGAR